MNIVILDGHALNPGDNPWTALEGLGTVSLYDRTPIEAIIERARDAEIVITNKVPLTAHSIAALPKLRYIGVTATGYNVVDIQAAAARHIPVCNVVAYGVNAVAQHVMALLLELCRRTSLHDASVRAGDWAKAPDWCYWKSPQIELTDKIMGIVGFGNIGSKVAELAHSFGMKILAYNRSPKIPPSYTPFSFVNQDTLFAKADVISLHCPLTDSNAGMINTHSLMDMKPGAILLNTARGQLLDESAVAEALHSGHLGGFGTDVLAQEPPDPSNPLLQAPRSLITPHISWATLNARSNIIRLTAENIRAWQAGTPTNVVNL
ncbi:MAG: D-2-hydroxyacid dehydrogenase [Desulfovibrionaceae bacterium]